MSEKPLDPRLPGKYGRMTAKELDEVVAKLDRFIPLSETRPMTAAEQKRWRNAKRKPGRPKRGEGVRVISLSVEKSLLDQADDAAKRAGISRAALFEKALREALGGPRKMAG